MLDIPQTFELFLRGGPRDSERKSATPSARPLVASKPPVGRARAGGGERGGDEGALDEDEAEAEAELGVEEESK